ncbi:MAG TPA: hypothetical protein DC049_11205, partial [Spirochaetia bacterium]|nr:hypothetical protein [Spirochaetia bacterium]
QAGSRHRLGMCRLAFGSIRQAVIDDYEIKKKGISYTINTVRYLKNKYKNLEKFYTIIGSDLLAELPSWKNFTALCRETSFLCFRRADTASSLKTPAVKSAACPDREPGKTPKIILFKNTLHPASSSAIRNHLASGCIRNRWLSVSVSAYIKKHNLYNSGK